MRDDRGLGLAQKYFLFRFRAAPWIQENQCGTCSCDSFFSASGSWFEQSSLSPRGAHSTPPPSSQNPQTLITRSPLRVPSRSPLKDQAYRIFNVRGPQETTQVVFQSVTVAAHRLWREWSTTTLAHGLLWRERHSQLHNRPTLSRAPTQSSI